MRQFVYTVAAGLLFVGMAGTTGQAVAKSHTKMTKQAASMRCPRCGMKMSTKKTAAMPQMMKVNGKTWYCCSACGSHAKAGMKKGM
jgi:uncharacterized protein with PIN domain